MFSNIKHNPYQHTFMLNVLINLKFMWLCGLNKWNIPLNKL